MFQWDVSVGCRWCQSRFKWSNAVKTFEMSTRHNRRTTRMDLYWELSVTGFIFTYVQKYFSGRGEGAIAPIAPVDPPLFTSLCDGIELNGTGQINNSVYFSSAPSQRCESVLNEKFCLGRSVDKRTLTFQADLLATRKGVELLFRRWNQLTFSGQHLMFPCGRLSWLVSAFERTCYTSISYRIVLLSGQL